MAACDPSAASRQVTISCAGAAEPGHGALGCCGSDATSEGPALARGPSTPLGGGAAAGEARRVGRDVRAERGRRCCDHGISLEERERFGVCESRERASARVSCASLGSERARVCPPCGPPGVPSCVREGPVGQVCRHVAACVCTSPPPPPLRGVRAASARPATPPACRPDCSAVGAFAASELPAADGRGSGLHRAAAASLGRGHVASARRASE